MNTDEATYKQAYEQVKSRLKSVLEENDVLRRRTGSNGDDSERMKAILEQNQQLFIERGDLQDAVMKRDDTIDMYRKWFRDHEHLVIRDDRPIRTQKDIFRNHNLGTERRIIEEVTPNFDPLLSVDSE